MILWYWYFWRYCVALIVRCCHVAMLPKFGIRGLGSTVFATAIVVRTWDGCPAFFRTKILQYFRKSKKRHTAGYTSMYAMYATACGYLFGMFHHTIPWGLFRKHAGQISLLSQSFTSWHPNGRSLSCISLLHRGRGPAAQPFCFFALALRLKKVGHIGFLTYWECLSGCLSLSSHSFLSFLSFLFASTALRHQLWTSTPKWAQFSSSGRRWEVAVTVTVTVVTATLAESDAGSLPRTLWGTQRSPHWDGIRCRCTCTSLRGLELLRL